MQVGLVILAAGEASRMGFAKQNIQFEGKTLLQRLISEAQETQLSPITVVLGAHKKDIVPTLKDLPITIIDNAGWKAGMGSSIKMGMIGTYLANKTLEAIIISTVDMPFVGVEIFKKLIDTAIQNPDKNIIASAYNGSLGIPVLFKRPSFELLLDIIDSDGAKMMIQANINETASVPFELGAFDLDSPEDIINFNLKFPKKS